jgi:hypothetical protein
MSVVLQPILQVHVMQSTTCLHNDAVKTILQAAYPVFGNPIAFHTAKGVFDADSERRDGTIGRRLRRDAFAPTRFFLRLVNGDSVAENALEAPILVEATAVWQGRALQLLHHLILGLAFIRGPQAAGVTALIGPEEVLRRVALFLGVVVCLLVLGISGARDRALSAIMPKREAAGYPPPVGRCTLLSDHQRFELGVALAVLTYDSAPHGGDESTDGHAIATSPRAVLGLLEWDSVSPMSG